jgi:hypothetical protein
MKESELIKEALAVWGEALAEVRAVPAVLIGDRAGGRRRRPLAGTA